MKNKILNPLKFAKCYIIWHTAFHKDNDDLAKIASLGAGACEYLAQIEAIIPMQYLAYKVSVLRNINPDQPRNLAKSVTVE